MEEVFNSLYALPRGAVFRKTSSDESESTISTKGFDTLRLHLRRIAYIRKDSMSQDSIYEFTIKQGNTVLFTARVSNLAGREVLRVFFEREYPHRLGYAASLDQILPGEQRRHLGAW
jgi:hypothetical protein